MPWKVAIVGGGPGGLAAAIALAQLNTPGEAPIVEWTLYEKKPRISETGGGISIQRHTWRLLARLGVADRIDSRDVFSAEDGRSVEHRNAVTGVLLARSYHGDEVPPHEISGRMLRAKLQAALLSAVDESRVVTGKKLETVEAVDAGGVKLTFADGDTSTVDLLVGADGIRSVARGFVAPEHTLQYNGQSAYRTILRADDVAAIHGIPRAPVFWQYVGGKYVYTCPLGQHDFELTARIRPASFDPDETAWANQVSWGQPYDLNRLLPQYAEFAPPLRALLRLAADQGGTQEFAMFNGPRLETVVRGVGTGGVVLLGDASHPLSGAFGAGAGFAFEDAYTLARALRWAHAGGRPLGDALTVYDRARSPHYANLYATLDRGGAAAAAVVAEGLPLHEEIAARVQRVWANSDEGAGWVYLYRADEVVEGVIQAVERETTTTTKTAIETTVETTETPTAAESAKTVVVAA